MGKTRIKDYATKKDRIGMDDTWYLGLAMAAIGVFAGLCVLAGIWLEYFFTVLLN